MEDSIFTKIIKRELPAEIIYEDDVCMVIPDKFPTTENQLLIITKEQKDYLFDLDDASYQHMMSITKKIVAALDKAFCTKRTCVMVEGFEVPHIHIKLYPCMEEALIWQPPTEATDAELKETATKVREALN